MNPLCARKWVTLGLEFEETALSTVAAVDLGTTLRWKAGGFANRKEGCEGVIEGLSPEV